MIKEIVKKNPLVCYFIIAYAITWILVLPIITHTVSENWHFLGALGPAISAFVVSYLTKGNVGISSLKDKIIKHRVGFRCILIALSPIFLLLVSLPIGYFISGSWFNFKQFIADNLYSPTSAFIWILPLLSYGVFEEIGWRGFALPHLQKKFSALTATFILSIFWFLWHFPMFFYRFDFSIGMVVGFFLGLLSGAILLTFIFNSTKGSVLMTIIWHVLWNLVAVLNMTMLSSIMSSIIMIVAILIILKFGAKNLSTNEKFIES